MKFKRNHLVIAALIIGALLYFRQSQGYVGGVSAGGRTSALPPGYRSEAPGR